MGGDNVPKLPHCVARLFELADAGALLSPADMLDAARECDPHAELDLDRVRAQVDGVAAYTSDVDVAGRPPEWQWNAANAAAVLRALLADQAGALFLATSLRRALDARAWYVAVYGADPFEQSRVDFVDLLVTALAAVTVAEWERPLFERPVAVDAGAIEPGRVLRDRRRAAGLTQEQLARALDVDRTTVGRWESGTRVAQRSSRVELARLLGGRAVDYDGVP